MFRVYFQAAARELGGDALALMEHSATEGWRGLSAPFREIERGIIALSTRDSSRTCDRLFHTENPRRDHHVHHTRLCGRSGAFVGGKRGARISYSSLSLSRKGKSDSLSLSGRKRLLDAGRLLPGELRARGGGGATGAVSSEVSLDMNLCACLRKRLSFFARISLFLPRRASLFEEGDDAVFGSGARWRSLSLSRDGSTVTRTGRGACFCGERRGVVVTVGSTRDHVAPRARGVALLALLLDAIARRLRRARPRSPRLAQFQTAFFRVNFQTAFSFLWKKNAKSGPDRRGRRVDRARPRVGPRREPRRSGLDFRTN